MENMVRLDDDERGIDLPGFNLTPRQQYEKAFQWARLMDRGCITPLCGVRSLYLGAAAVSMLYRKVEDRYVRPGSWRHTFLPF